MWFHSRSPKTKRRVRYARPALEALEDRLAPAMTITVTTFADVVNPSDGKTSLREAISQANATAELDKIVLSAGVYKIERAGEENGNATGDFDVTNPLKL